MTNYLEKTDDKFSVLARIKCQYGLNENANELINSFFSESNEESIYRLQNALVEFILNDKYLRVYKPYSKYRKSFLKTVINLVEGRNHEVNEDLFNHYIEIINNKNSSSEDDNSYFVVFFDQVNM